MVAPSPMLKPLPATTGLGEKAQQPDVMGAMPKAPSKAPPQSGASMTPVQIIQTAMQQGGEDPSAAESFLRNCDKLVTMGLAQSLQIGNSLFILLKMNERGQPLPQGTAVMLPFTAEENQIEQRLKVLPNSLRQLGFRKVTMKTDDQADIAAMQQAGLTPQVRQEMTYTGQRMAPMYVIDLEV